MNELDKQLHKSLKFFADNSRAKAEFILEEIEQEYRASVTKEIEEHLYNSGYISPQGITKYAITEEGLEELRKLEKIKNGDWSLRLSIIAIILSIFTLAVTQGWITWG